MCSQVIPAAAISSRMEVENRGIQSILLELREKSRKLIIFKITSFVTSQSGEKCYAFRITLKIAKKGNE